MTEGLIGFFVRRGRDVGFFQRGVFLNVLEVISRFFVAIISAYLAGQLFEADLLFTALKADQTTAVLPLIYFVAGFSERLIPSIVTTLGKKEEDVDCD